MKRFVLPLLVLAPAAALAQDPPPDPMAPATDPAPVPPPPPDPSMQPPPPPPPPGGDPAVVTPHERVPGPILPNMLPTRYGATVDIRGDYTHSGEDDVLFGDLFLLGFNFYGQYIAPEGYGGYAQMPYWIANANDETEHGVGNLEVGGLYLLKNSPQSEVLLRGGIALDTAGSFGDFFAPFAAIGPRLYDAYPTGFASHWLRVDGSFRHHANNVHLGVSGGADLPLGGGEDSITDELDALVKIAASVALDAGGASVGFGIVGMTAVGVDSEEEWIFGANAIVAFPVSPTMSLYGSFGYPDLEENEFDLFGIGAGLRIAAQ